MDTKIIKIVIGREYFVRVKKKSFLLITFLVPILFAAMCVLPSLIMVGAKEESKLVAVVDRSGLMTEFLQNSEVVEYQFVQDMPLDSIKANLATLGYDAVLSISEMDAATKTLQADVFWNKPLGVELCELLGNRIDDAVEDYRIKSYNIEDLATIMQDVKSDIKLHTYTLGEDGSETITESGVYMGVSMILGMIVYMFVAIFGGMLMSSVIEEKSSRVVEVLISSVKASELMFGKIIGIALVALTQFLLWIILSVAIIGIASVALGDRLLPSSNPAELVQMAGVDASQADAIASMVSEPSGLSVIVSSLSNLPIAQIIICFILFFIFGYMLYASLFAAVGSAVENEGDSAQLQMPLTIPLLLGFFIAFYAFKAPGSPIVFWGSMIPFTSPIVMLARIPYGVPTWEIVLSLVLLIATFFVCAWLSAKIYKVGILMFGKKSTWKDLWKWLKMK